MKIYCRHQGKQLERLEWKAERHEMLSQGVNFMIIKIGDIPATADYNYSEDVIHLILISR